MNELLLGVLPVAGMGLAACLLFLLAIVVKNGRTMGVLGLLSFALLGGGPVALLWSQGGKVVPQALLSSDTLALFFDALFVLAAIFTAALSLDYFAKKGVQGSELYGLVAVAVAGMMVLASATVSALMLWYKLHKLDLIGVLKTRE